MQIEVMFAGFGGQGIMMAGKVFARAAMERKLEVVWVPSYGPEMRGGTANCVVVVSDRAIGSPIIRNPQHLIAMNRPSLEKFGEMVKPGGVILVNSSLVDVSSGRKDVDELQVPATDVAHDLGDVKVASIVLLAAFCERSGTIPLPLLRQVVTKEFKGQPELIAMNLNAIEKGADAAKANA